MAGIYFYGHSNGKPHPHFSNFFPVPGGFEHNEVQFKTSEHALMYEKALLMGDAATALKIRNAKNPLDAKRLGRKVKPWNQARWEANCEGIMTAILVSKFSVPAMRPLLADTGTSNIYEASPRDKIWGIGISVAKAEAGGKHDGRNLLGKCLMRARDSL